MRLISAIGMLVCIGCGVTMILGSSVLASEGAPAAGGCGLIIGSLCLLLAAGFATVVFNRGPR